MSSPSWASLPPFPITTLLGHHRAQSWAPCAIQQLPTSYLFYTLATHSSVLAWRIPGMGEPGGLPSMGSHRVGHDWSDLAAAAVDICQYYSLNHPTLSHPLLLGFLNRRLMNRIYSMSMFHLALLFVCTHIRTSPSACKQIQCSSPHLLIFSCLSSLAITLPSSHSLL